MQVPAASPQPPAAPGEAAFNSAQYGATVPPWSAAHAVHQPVPAEGARPPPPWSATSTAPRPATRTRRTTSCSTSAPCRSRCSKASRSASSRPGIDANGKPHFARQYSVASPRNGERPGYNNVSLTVKRVLEDHQGKPVRGVGSNYMCDLKVGDKVQVIGPVRRVLPDAEPPEVAHRDDLHRHRQRADARDDRMAPAPAQERQVRRRQADAVLRRAHAAGAAVLRPAADPAEGLHRHQLRVLAHAGPAQALRAGPDARARRRPGRAAEGRPDATSTSAA